MDEVKKRREVHDEDNQDHLHRGGGKAEGGREGQGEEREGGVEEDPLVAP